MNYTFRDYRNFVWTEAATEGITWKKVFLEISQNSQENTCAKLSFLISGTGVFLSILWNF